MMTETTTTTTETQTGIYMKLNGPLCGGAIHVVPDNSFGVKIDGDRVLSFGPKGAVDVTEFAVPVSRVETRTQKAALEPGQIFVFDGGLHQTIVDNDATITAFSFNTKTVVTVSPERLSLMGDVRAIGVVYLPEANAFGGNMFLAMKNIAAAGNDRQLLFELRRKESLWAQRHGLPEPGCDGLDEVMLFASTPGMTAFQTFVQAQAQTKAIQDLADSMNKLAAQVATVVAPKPAPKPAAKKPTPQTETK